MPTIHRVCCQMKESELVMAPEEWQHAVISYNVTQHVLINAMSPKEKGTKYPTNTGQDPMDLDEPVLLDKKVSIPAFTSKIVLARTKEMFMLGRCLNVMVQPPYLEDHAKLPVGLYIQRVYTELHNGTQGLSMRTGKPINLAAGRLVGQVVAANAVPNAVPLPELEVKLDEESNKPTPLTLEQRQELLMEALEKNGNLGNMDAWPPETVLKVKRLLMEFHHIFSLEPNKIGCTNATEHVIELLPDQDEPFKDRFRCIVPHEVEEVRQHLQEMLDGGAIQPLQSPWCNAVVLVRKKDGTLR